jgi:hypothetical protein
MRNFIKRMIARRHAKRIARAFHQEIHNLVEDLIVRLKESDNPARTSCAWCFVRKLDTCEMALARFADDTATIERQVRWYLLFRDDFLDLLSKKKVAEEHFGEYVFHKEIRAIDDTFFNRLERLEEARIPIMQAAEILQRKEEMENEEEETQHEGQTQPTD